MNQVTISLEQYDSMKMWIAELEKQVEQKTIVKTVKPDWWHVLCLIAGIALLAWFISMSDPHGL